MISGYGCYLKYLAIKYHFQNEKYDYIKYHGVVRAKETSYKVRNDRYYFEKLAKKLKDPEEVERFFVANFVENPDIWVGQLVGEEGVDAYTRWKSKLESISYRFEMDLDKLLDLLGGNKKFADLFKVNGGQYPIVLKMLIRNELSIESIIILNTLVYDFVGDWNQQISDKIVYPEHQKRILKYAAFLNRYLTNEQKKNLKKKFQSKLLDNL